MVLKIIFKPLLFNIIFTCVYSNRCTYKGAVYEYELPYADPFSTNYSVDQYINTNLKNYKHVLQIAASKKLNIIIFPEYGIIGNHHKKRSDVYPYLEIVQNFNHAKKSYYNKEIIKRLKLWAKLYTIYIVINLGELFPCTKESISELLTDFGAHFYANVDYGSLCPVDGNFQFNTNIVIDDKGEIIAKYRKCNLYADEMDYFDSPLQILSKLSNNSTKNEDINCPNSFFGTNFGANFTTFICFDLRFKDPAILSISNKETTPRPYNVAYPTDWPDALPITNALQAQYGYAVRTNVNLLAANLRYFDAKYNVYQSGSGIYAGYSGYINTFYDTIESFNHSTHSGVLLISRLCCVPSFDCIHNETQSVYVEKLRDDNTIVNTFAKYISKPVLSPSDQDDFLFYHPIIDLPFTLYPLNISKAVSSRHMDIAICEKFRNGRDQTFVIQEENVEDRIEGADFCCRFRYQSHYMRAYGLLKDSLKIMSNDKHGYFLALYTGTMKGDALYEWNMQVCAILKCPVRKMLNSLGQLEKVPHHCGEPTETLIHYLYNENSYPSADIELIGHMFPSNYVFPTILKSDNRPFSTKEWSFITTPKNRIGMKNSICLPTLNYTTDPQLKEGYTSKIAFKGRLESINSIVLLGRNFGADQPNL